MYLKIHNLGCSCDFSWTLLYYNRCSLGGWVGGWMDGWTQAAQAASVFRIKDTSKIDSVTNEPFQKFLFQERTNVSFTFVNTNRRRRDEASTTK